MSARAWRVEAAGARRGPARRLLLNAKTRAAFVDDLGRYWGERWFTIPNPSYGSWERSAGMSVDAKRKALRQ